MEPESHAKGLAQLDRTAEPDVATTLRDVSPMSKVTETLLATASTGESITIRPGRHGHRRRPARHVPNMYQHHGKQRGVEGNKRELQTIYDLLKWPLTRKNV